MRVGVIQSNYVPRQGYFDIIREIAILDLLFCCGPDSARRVWGWRQASLRARPATFPTVWSAR